MHQTTTKRSMSGKTIAAIVAATLVGGGAIAGVANYVASQRVTVTTEDGSQYEFEIADEATDSVFVTDEGETIYLRRTDAGEGQTQLDVTLDAPGETTMTVTSDGED